MSSEGETVCPRNILLLISLCIFVYIIKYFVFSFSLRLFLFFFFFLFNTFLSCVLTLSYLRFTVSFLFVIYFLYCFCGILKYYFSCKNFCSCCCCWYCLNLCLMFITYSFSCLFSFTSESWLFFAPLSTFFASASFLSLISVTFLYFSNFF